MTTRRQLDRIAERRRRTVLAAWNEVLSDIRDQATIQEIAHALNAGRVDSAVDLLQLDRATYEPLEHEILEAYREGGRTGAGQVGRIPMEQGGQLVARFDIRAPGAEAWAASMSSRLVVEIVEAQRETVRGYIVQGLANGQNPRSVALDLVGRVSQSTRRREGGIIALTNQQAGWVQSARQELQNLDPNYLTRQLRDRRFDAAFERALREGRPMRAGQIDAAVNRMQTRAERYRAETIARTESINALRAGQQEAVRQAFDKSDILDKEIEKEWDASGDGRTRPDHDAADGQTVVGLNTPFIVGGEQLLYPGDPSGSAANTVNCRCRIIERVRWGSRVRRLEGFG